MNNFIIDNLDLNKKVDYKLTNFSNGEVSVEFIEPAEKLNLNCLVTITGSITKHEHIFELMAIKQLLDSTTNNIYLTLHHHLYGRQDRNHQYPALSHMGKVFANIINSMNFTNVTLLHPHSDVLPSLINNCKSLLCDLTDLIKTQQINILVLPDKGAYAQLTPYIKQHNLEYIVLDKSRDFNTGNITSTSIYKESPGAYDLDTPNMLIVDDICDGGATFIKAVSLLNTQYSKPNISLFVNYGIFSKGINHLFDNGISKIFVNKQRIVTELQKEEVCF